MKKSDDLMVLGKRYSVEGAYKRYQTLKEKGNEGRSQQEKYEYILLGETLEKIYGKKGDKNDQEIL